MAKIGIRVDGNSKIGTGHMMRCLAIADQIKAAGSEVIFFVADCEMIKLIDEKGYASCCLESTWNNLDLETEKFIEELNKKDIGMLLLDTYFVTDEYLRTIRNAVRTAYIDDLFMFDYKVDVLINYSSYADIKRYTIHDDTKYCMGTEYAPLREQFQNLKLSDEKHNNILVLSGGTDPYNMTVDIPKALLLSDILSDYHFMVIQGIYAKESEKLTSKRITYYKNVKDMVSLMMESDVAISAGGTTLYELCDCQIPTTTYSFVDNQLDNVRAFDRLGVMPYSGDLRDDKEAVIRKIVKNVENLVVSQQTECKRKMGKLVDGQGANRIARVLIENSTN